MWAYPCICTAPPRGDSSVHHICPYVNGHMRIPILLVIFYSKILSPMLIQRRCIGNDLFTSEGKPWGLSIFLNSSLRKTLISWCWLFFSSQSLKDKAQETQRLFPFQIHHNGFSLVKKNTTRSFPLCSFFNFSFVQFNSIQLTWRKTERVWKQFNAFIETVVTYSCLAKTIIISSK